MSSNKKRILFVGMPDMAIVVFNHLIDKGFNIVGIVPPLKEEATYPMMEKLASYFNIPFLPYDSLKSSKFIKSVKKLNPDIGIVCSFNKKLPKEFLQATKDGFLNCHPSLLPLYRGGNPYSAVLMNKEKVTGVTIHFMDETFDTGDIVLQLKVNIDKDETMGTLFNKLNYACANAMEITLHKYENDGHLVRMPQSQGDFIKAPNFEPNSYQTFIDWTKSGEDIMAKVRALNPFISATTLFRHTVLKIHACDFLKRQTNVPLGCVADLIGGFGISCLDGIIYIKSLQFGTYIITDGVDFVKRFSPKVGEQVG